MSFPLADAPCSAVESAVSIVVAPLRTRSCCSSEWATASMAAFSASAASSQPPSTLLSSIVDTRWLFLRRAQVAKFES
jgi:hypothetical protein